MTHRFQSKEEPKSKDATLDISDQMNRIMEEKMASFSVKKVERTAEDDRVKAAILASYAEVPDGPSDEEEDSAEEGGGRGGGRPRAEEHKRRGHPEGAAGEAGGGEGGGAGQEGKGQAGQGEPEEAGRGQEKEGPGEGFQRGEEIRQMNCVPRRVDD